MNPIRLHILEREIESLCTLALETADELESRSPGSDGADSAVLAQAVAQAYFAQREKLGFPGLKKREEAA